MERMVVTEEVFQEFRGWLKAVAEKNVKSKDMTLETSQEFKSWLKEVAERNIESI